MNENEKKLSEILKLYADNCAIRNNNINVSHLLAEQDKKLNTMIDDLDLNKLSNDELEVFNMHMDLFESQRKDIKLEKKEVCEFEFVKIGEAYLCDEPLKATHEGKPLKDWKLKLRLLVNEDILNAEQSTYLIYDNDNLLYVGYFSNSFKKRWWKKKGYFWHGDIVDNKVNELVKKEHNISVWISINPYVDNFNISKLLEDKIIVEYANKGILNTVGKNLKDDIKNTKSVMEILNINV